MFSRRIKTRYFVLEGLNSFATVYFFYYFYFFMQKWYGFDNKANLELAALNGATYAAFAWLGGKFAQRLGYFRALKVGYLIMSSALLCGLLARSVGAQVTVMVVTVVGMSFTWPTLEALVSEGEPAGSVQHMVGIYNVVWAGTAAVANFMGGAMLEKLGPASLFYVPAACQLTQLGLILWLEHELGQSRGEEPDREAAGSAAPLPRVEAATVSGSDARTAAAALPVVVSYTARLGPEKAKSFLRMAWLANPFAYIALNTVIAVIPGVTARLGLSTTLAGFCCSVWCFARLGAFWGLWLWEGWHYRFRWLLLAYLALVGSFTGLLLAPNVAILVATQVVFGGAIGLLYYSSLFYSMDCSETKGEHGGIHESAIGLGNFAGPAVGAAALQFLPRYPNSGTVAVSLLLLCGLGGLAAIWKKG